MKDLNKAIYISKHSTWEERSGFLEFLSLIQKEIKKFNKTFDFDIKNVVTPPSSIDGKSNSIVNVGFVMIWNNPLMPDRVYCIYSILNGRELYGYLGLYNNGEISTIRELGIIKEFSKGLSTLYDWNRALIKASCDKY